MNPVLKLEYLWLDGLTPEPLLRSKSRSFPWKSDTLPLLDEIPQAYFDGSATSQAEIESSDLLLKPVKIVPDPARPHSLLILSEVCHIDGSSHPSSTRDLIGDHPGYQFKLEQEYVMKKDDHPLGFPARGYPEREGAYYCGLGQGRAEGRDIAEEHYDLCLQAGLDLRGINAELMIGQWEFQVFGANPKEAADALWLARFLLIRTAEKHGVTIDFQPKPIHGNWHGSGLHVHFSNERMRNEGGKELFESICKHMGPLHEEHIAVYGSHNEERLTGKNETQSIDTFTYGVGDRGASLRIPARVLSRDWKGFIEDRRPAANADPYRVITRIIQTIESYPH